MNLNVFNTTNLFEAATNLFQQLGIKLNSRTAQPLPTKDILKHYYKDNATFQSINHTYFLGIIDDSVFQLTDKVKRNYSYDEALSPHFQEDDKNYHGLMVFALQLNKQPTRSEIAELARAFNRISQKMPVALLLTYPPTSLLENTNQKTEALISLALSERFKYLQNWRPGEKAGKVIMLRDIHTQNTHAGHIRILQDLVKPAGVSTYHQLHQHWLQVLDVNILNKKFYQELSDWYFASLNEVSFPEDVENNKEIRNATNLIRLITRVIFIWFIKEKGLVSDHLFRKDFVAKILKDFNKNKQSHNYYNAILQNLFFGTLNQKIEERKFANEGDIRTNKEEYGVKNLFRYADLFTISPKEVLALFKDIPFLNGGLFDCLDKPNEEGKILYVDGFSRNPKKKAIVPDYIFFGEEKEVDLNEIYGTKNKRYKTRGLINLLESYKFTVAENTPLEEEVALDPELLGKVFENLLASYNPETQTTARKQTGSFYTPREIVDYMVDESLLEYLKSTVNISPNQGTVSILADQGTVSILADQDTISILADDVTFFNPDDEIEIYQGNLPHWQQKGVWYFVTFRLADSIPIQVAEQIKKERELWKKKNRKDNNGNYSKAQIKEYNRLFSDRIEALLNDCRGSCILKIPSIAKIVANALLHFKGQRYELDAWVIMPNHVHVLVKPLGDNRLDEILHSWKSFTANEINKALGKKGQVWMHESFDHIVRNERAFQAIRNYIAQNPVKARLKEGEFLLSSDVSTSTDQGTVSILADDFRSKNDSGTFDRSKDDSGTFDRSKDDSGTFDRSKDASGTLEARLRDLFSYSEKPNPFNEEETQALIKALHNCKILDPACGSGAFLMGILHKMVHILQKLDPDNKYWKELQRQKAIEETKEVFNIGNKEERDKRLAEINDVFENNTSDYGRKLYLIENCIYGIDIQPIAVQIAKLRFFISLIIDQKVSPSSVRDNMGIRPLPNLETKFVAANTLIGLDKPQQLSIRNPKIDEKEKELKDLRHAYFTANTRKKKLDLQHKDKKLRKQIAEILKSDGWPSTVAEQIASFDPYDQNAFATWFDHEWMFGLKSKQGDTGVYDIVIGNPPYVSTKGVAEHEKKILEQQFGFADDLYNHFYYKGIELLKTNGILAYISSKTFWTIQTKKNLRQLLLKNKLLQLVDTDNPFESAMVDTCITIVQKDKANDYEIRFIDISNGWDKKQEYKVKNIVYKNVVNNVFFKPNELNMKIYERIAKNIKPLIEKWWDKISTSKNVEKYKRELEQYRQSLKPGDITLLGLITEGGQGLATANNGKFIGVLEGTKWADKVRQERPQKLWEFIQNFNPKELSTLKTKSQVQDYLNNLSENQIRELFDSLREKYGRDIFGQGWLYRIVRQDEIADIEKLTDDEKLNGIKGKKTFVPYDKGDKDGNRWWAPTPYYIDWSRENVKFLKENSGKKGEGMPVVRNPQFYFREGFCWNNVLSDEKIKCRLKDKTVHSTEAMTFMSVISKKASDRYLICLLNSKLFGNYRINFVNVSHHLTTGDAKEFPVIIPTQDKLNEFENIFDRAKRVQEEKFSGKISEKGAEKKLEKIQTELDEKVLELYGLN